MKQTEMCILHIKRSEGAGVQPGTEGEGDGSAIHQTPRGAEQR